jgi:transposase
MKTPRPKRIDLKPADVEALLQRVEKGALQEGDYEIIKAMVETIGLLSQSLDDKATAIKRLLRMIFGATTETMEKVLKNRSKLAEAIKDKTEPVKQNGHGKNGAADYIGAERIPVSNETLKAGDPCPECPKGKVYPIKTPGVVVRFVGMAPLGAKIYELEKLRCNLCGVVLTADAPGSVGSAKYDETAGSMIANLKYGSGVPFYRIEKLQESLGLPLPASTQWDIVENMANRIYPAYRGLIHEAAQGDVIHNDDTTMKILALMKHSAEISSRTGMFTTGMVSIVEDRKIALFFTGEKHAGENMADLLKLRHAELEPPIQMCDALSRNRPEEVEILLANCLIHGRRNFVDIASSFPEETGHVISEIAQVYKNDKTARELNLSPQERLLFHQRESGPVMKNLKGWLSEQIDQRKAEPNSGLGKAIVYMLKHWEPLTLFLRAPGAPLDNNLCERALKKAILNRKNSLFYKTEHGAFIGDMFMSLIHTCNLGKVNPFDYLTALQQNSSAVFKNPRNWLPWNYQNSILINDS